METKEETFIQTSNLRFSDIQPPSKELYPTPGDLTLFSPYGNSVCGYQDGTVWDPFKGAPNTQEAGGVLYFGNDITRDDFVALMRVLGVDGKTATSQAYQYALYMSDAEEPQKQSYLTQMRVVSRFGLQYMFHSISSSEYDDYPKQAVEPVDALWSFIEFERKKWGTSCFQNGPISGIMGGDGNYSREELSFGFMRENNYYDVCRIWSRAWIVTK